MSLTLFKKMFGIPSQKPLTKTQRFTVVSSTISYIIGGISLMLWPELWNLIFGFELTPDLRGYLLLFGEGVMIIGFMLVVLSRGKSIEVPGMGAILAPIFSRVVLVNLVTFSLYINGLVTLMFSLTFSILDTSLAVITYVIWKGENENAGLKQFFKEIWVVVNPWSAFHKKFSFKLLQLIGFLQVFIGLAAPVFLKSSGAVDMATFGTHSGGLLLGFLTTFCFHGSDHVLSGGDCNYSFLMFALFYRVVWNIPFFLFAGFTAKISAELATFFVLFDVCYCVIISFLLFLDRKSLAKKN